jgi:hypothetical protein
LDRPEPERFLQDNLAIEGGHYVIEGGREAIGDVEIYTWEEAARLYGQAIKKGFKNVGLILLIDDFGEDPKARQGFHAGYKLPEPYRAALDKYDLGAEHVRISWSTQLRNRATKDLRKMRVKNAEKSGEGYTAKLGDGGHRLLTHGTCPVCGSIVARHFKEKSDKFKYNINIYSWKWDGSNENGLRLARLLYGIEMKCYNFYFVRPNVIMRAEV